MPSAGALECAPKHTYKPFLSSLHHFKSQTSPFILPRSALGPNRSQFNENNLTSAQKLPPIFIFTVFPPSPPLVSSARLGSARHYYSGTKLIKENNAVDTRANRENNIFSPRVGVLLNLSSEAISGGGSSRGGIRGKFVPL